MSVQRLIVFVIVVIAAVWAFRWWEARPGAEPPEIIWTSAPFRGPTAHAEPGKGAPIDCILVALSPEPLLEAPQTVPSPNVFLRQPTSFAHGLAESLSWRKPFTTIDKMSPADLAAWGVRYYTFTGATTAVGSKQWGEYRRNTTQPRSVR